MMAAQQQAKIDVSCNSCGKRFSAPQKAAGHKIACPNCKSPMVVGQARQERSPNPESASPHKTRILCAFCNETLIILPKMLDETMVCSKCGGDIDYTAYEPLAKILKEREEAKRAERERVKAEKAAQREKAKHERAASRERKRAERDERKALAEREKRRDLVETRASPVAIQREQPIAVVQPGLEHGHAAGVPSINVHIPKRASSMGIASLVLAIVALAFSWIPFVGALAIPLSVLALILALVGFLVALSRRASGIGYPIAGGLTAALALSISTSMTWAINDAITSVTSGGRHEREAARVTQATPVTSDAPAASNSSAATTDTDTDSDDGAPTASTNSEPDVLIRPTKQEPIWALASTSLQLGDIRIRITHVVVGNVPLWQDIVDREGQSEDQLLTVWLEITNTSERKKVDYRGWMSDYASLLDIDAELTDDVDNDYRKIRFSATLSVKDAKTNASVYPGKSINDAVVFEPPVDGTKFLRLKLSGKAFGEDGEFRFQIPKHMIRQR